MTGRHWSKVVVQPKRHHQTWGLLRGIWEWSWGWQEKKVKFNGCWHEISSLVQQVHSKSTLGWNVWFGTEHQSSLWKYHRYVDLPTLGKFGKAFDCGELSGGERQKMSDIYIRWWLLMVGNEPLSLRSLRTGVRVGFNNWTALNNDHAHFSCKFKHTSCHGHRPLYVSG